MRNKPCLMNVQHPSCGSQQKDRWGKQSGFTLIELIAFMVVVSVALVSLVSVFNRALENSVDPVVQIRALECAQAKMDEVLARKFDQATPTGGVPACNSAEVSAPSCVGISAESSLNDVGDYNGHTDNTKAGCSISVSVAAYDDNSDGTDDDLGIATSQVRRITVTATSDGGGQVALSAYKANF